MRKSSLLAPLISAVVQDLLATILLSGPDRRWYMSELAKKMERRPSSLQRPLADLVEAGILCSWREGNRTYFRANSDCPILGELRSILTKSVGLADRLRETLEPFVESIKTAFIHGSVASGTETPGSDVDLIVIGTVGLSDLCEGLEALEAAIQRSVHITVVAPDEFRRKVLEGNHFWNAVLGKEKLFVVGGADELEAIVGRAPR